MTPSGNLLAWIEPHGADSFLGAFVGEDAAKGGHRASGRLPAIQPCSSWAEAKQWIEAQAADLDLPIKWMAAQPPSAVD